MRPAPVGVNGIPNVRIHPTRQFTLAALNAGLAPHWRRSDALGLTSQTDPDPTFMSTARGWSGRQGAAIRICPSSC
jgi:hypothetical protein